MESSGAQLFAVGGGAGQRLGEGQGGFFIPGSGARWVCMGGYFRWWVGWCFWLRGTPYE